jgi:MFS transporter, DHA2 family, multidrug resistance protein
MPQNRWRSGPRVSRSFWIADKPKTGSKAVLSFSSFSIALVALIAAALWEWRHPDPVVEIPLLADRNFAIANVYYFLFGFALFGSTVLIPQMLESLYGYTATDAGLVLGPGALVIVALAPLIVKVLPRVGIKPLIFTGYVIFAMAMWRYASIDLGADYKHIALARAIQGLGIAPLFVPVSQLAYSSLPKNKNNKASSLTNLFRNQGGSVGIAFVTTILARRMQYHQSALVAHAMPFQPRYQERFGTLSRYFLTHGFTAPDAALHAKAQLAQIIQHQAAFLGFLDCFWLLGCACLLGAPLVFFTRKFASGGSGARH